jgi:hypothetical protein
MINTVNGVLDRSEDVSGATKNADRLADVMRFTIEDIGPDNMVLVVLDNAANAKAAGKSLEDDFSHIMWVGCITHSLNLLLKDIGELDWVETVLNSARQSSQKPRQAAKLACRGGQPGTQAAWRDWLRQQGGHVAALLST